MTTMYSSVKIQSSRINDYMYDPNFIVPTEKDHKHHCIKATMAAAQMEIAPVYANMFSELVHCPRKAIVMKVRPKHRTSTFISKEQRDKASTLYSSSQHRPPDVGGADRAKFFKTPIVTLSPEMLHTVIFDKHRHGAESPKEPAKGPKNKSVQTMYRESSAQTKHWKPPHYTIVDHSDPEILKLNFLENNLPPGMHEVEMVLRARNRRNWETLLPDVENAATLEERRLILEAIELDIWAFREEEIASIQALRFELLERMLQELLNATADRTDGKIKRITDRLQHRHQQQIAKMKHNKSRELRRLYRQNFGINSKYKQENIIDQYGDYNSELYAPLMRHGEHPMRGHESIQLQYDSVMYDVETVSTLPRWLYKGKLVNPNEIKLPGRHLCIRETRWTEPVLKQLHDELLHLDKTTRIKCTLREKRAKPRALQDTLYIPHDEDDDVDEEKNEAVLILQCIIRGRAAQTLIYEGRDRCRELIEELQSTHFLDLNQYTEMRKMRMEVLGQQRNQQVQWEREEHLEGALQMLQGHVVGTMLDFLSKELVRVRDERKAHALALLYERERRDREAAEAGRRQAEERRRSEHDEMFKQIVKVHQESVDLYLQDIVTEGISDASDSCAKRYVTRLAAQIEEKIKNPPREFLEKEELIADLVCHFLLPDVEKIRIREKVKERQKKYLRCAHEIIFNKIEKLPQYKDDEVDACLGQNDTESDKRDSTEISSRSDSNEASQLYE